MPSNLPVCLPLEQARVRDHKAMMVAMRASNAKTAFVYTYCRYRFAKAGSAKHAAEWFRLSRIAGQYGDA